MEDAETPLLNFADDIADALVYFSRMLGAGLLALVGLLLVLHAWSGVWMRLRRWSASFRIGQRFLPTTVRFKATSASATSRPSTSSANGNKKETSPVEHSDAAATSFGLSPTPDLSRQVSNASDAAFTPASSTTAGGTPAATAATPKQQPVVVITGGGMGVGRGLAERYGGLGYHVIIWDVLPATELNAICAEIKAQQLCPDHAIVEGYHVDVTSIDAVATASRVLEERGLVPDLLVLNAGVVNGRRIIVKPSVLPQVKRLLDVNVFHLFNVTSHVMPRMINAAMKEEMKSGHPLHRGIVVLGSVAGFAGTARMCDYNASKAAANVFAEALAAEIKASCGGSVGMRVTLVCPYQINTGMFKGAKTLTGFRELRTEDVVAAIVDGVSLKKRLIVLPHVLLLYLAFKAIVPWWMLSWADWVLGGSRAIGQDFKGRHGGATTTTTASGRGTPQHGSAMAMAEPPSIESLIARRKHSSPPPPFISPGDADAAHLLRGSKAKQPPAAPGSSSSTSPNQPRLAVDFPNSPAAVGGGGGPEDEEGGKPPSSSSAPDDPEVAMLSAEGLRAAASAETLPPRSPSSPSAKGDSVGRGDLPPPQVGESEAKPQGIRKRRATSKK